jgi:hypothetical protein
VTLDDRPAWTTPVAAAGVARYRAKPFDARSALTYVGGFFAVGVGLSVVYATTGVGAPCPFRTFTGWNCPLCGGTRMGSAILHGDPAAAFSFNPLAFIGLAVITVLGLLWIVEALGGPKVRPPRRIAERLVRVHPTQWLILGLVVAAVYTVLRNLL